MSSIIKCLVICIKALLHAFSINVSNEFFDTIGIGFCWLIGLFILYLIVGCSCASISYHLKEYFRNRKEVRDFKHKVVS